MGVRSGEIKTIYHRIQSAGTLQVIGNPGPLPHEDGSKINKVTVCNLNSCTAGIKLTVAFIIPVLNNYAGLIPYGSGFYIYKDYLLRPGETLIIDRHYFDKPFYYTAPGKEASAPQEADLQIAFRVDVIGDCRLTDEDPGIDVHITK